MELDDLRRQWQQPENTPPVGPAELGNMLTRNAGGLVEKMRRNTWFELIATAMVAAGVPVYLWYNWGFTWRLRYTVAWTSHLLLAGLLLIMSVVVVVHYRRQLQLLRQMAHPETQVRTHLGALCAGLRRQLRFYYRLSLASAPATLVLLFTFSMSQLLRAHLLRWQTVAGTAVSFVVVGVVVQIGTVYLTRWFLHRFYGRHLDRLEASLRELDEPEPAAIR
jgi:hypothetical protein